MHNRLGVNMLNLGVIKQNSESSDSLKNSKIAHTITELCDNHCSQKLKPKYQKEHFTLSKTLADAERMLVQINRAGNMRNSVDYLIALNTKEYDV